MVMKAAPNLSPMKHGTIRPELDWLACWAVLVISRLNSDNGESSFVIQR
jgi:hypothetical protein